MSLISVAICTFRRPSVLTAIEGIAGQVLPSGYFFEMIIVDNDEHPLMRSAILDFGKSRGIEVNYIHAPARNISVARNACLAAAKGRWLAFHDDDGLAAHDWLAKLLNHSQGATAIFGLTKAVYGDETPGWIQQADFHSNHFDSPRGGYTSNVLIDMNFVRANKLSFDESLGRTGGEDTLLFYQIYYLNGVLKFVPDAVVWEDVPAERADLLWIMKRRFRYGQIHGKLLEKFEPRNFNRLLISATAKCLFCGAATILTLYSPIRSSQWAARGALHVGALFYRINRNIYKEYASR